MVWKNKVRVCVCVCVHACVCARVPACVHFRISEWQAELKGTWLVFRPCVGEKIQEGLGEEGEKRTLGFSLPSQHASARDLPPVSLL